MTPEEYVYRVMEIVADSDDALALGEELFFHRGNGFLIAVDKDNKRLPDDRPLIAAILCNDVYYWATSDMEDIAPEDIDDLRAAVEEFSYWGALIWVSRKRGLRPMSMWLNKRVEQDREDFPLDAFLAAGPERTRESEG